MPRLPKGTREQIITTTKRKLLDAAAAEFAQQGYVGANINRISQAAGFAKGTIYNYFSSKRTLMLALIEDIAVVHIDSVFLKVKAAVGPIQRLDSFFRAGFAFVEQHPTQAQVIINAVYGPDAEFRAQIYQAYDRLFSLLIQTIEEGIAQGAFRPIDLDLASALIMSIYLGSCSQLDEQGKIWLDPNQVVQFILDGLRPGVQLANDSA